MGGEMVRPKAIERVCVTAAFLSGEMSAVLLAASNVVLRLSRETAFVGLCLRSKSSSDFMIPNFSGDTGNSVVVVVAAAAARATAPPKTEAMPALTERPPPAFEGDENGSSGAWRLPALVVEELPRLMAVARSRFACGRGP